MARALQGAFGAILAPSALGTLVSTFRDPRERGRAFGVFGSVAAGGGAVGLILGGVLTQYFSWRWSLYVNLFFAAIAVTGALAYMQTNRPDTRPQMDWAGAVLACGRAVPALVFGFSHAETRRLDRPADHRLAGRCGVILLAAFVFAEQPGQSPAAAAAGGPGPGQGRLLRLGRPGWDRDLRRLPVPHVLPADDQGTTAR